MNTPMNSDMADKQKSSDDICVPLRSLASVDENEESTPPEPGNTVSFDVVGKLSRIEGDMAYVTPTEINGEPAQTETKPEGESSDDLEAAMQSADEGNYQQ